MEILYGAKTMSRRSATTPLKAIRLGWNLEYLE